MTDRRLSPSDAVWLYSEFPGNHQTVSAVMWADRLIDPDDYRALVQERMVDRYPTFSQRIRMSRNPLMMPNWEDDPDFDINNHIEVMDLPAPADKATLERVVSEQRSTMLPEGRPLWKFHLLQGYQQEGYGSTTAVHARIQHSIADGWALTRVVLSLADEGSDIERPNIVDKERKRKRDVVGRMAQPVMGAAEGVSDAVSTAASSVTEAVANAAGAVTKATDAVTGAVSDAVRDPGSIGARLAGGQGVLEETLSVDLSGDRFAEFGDTLPGVLTKPFTKGKDVAETTSGGAKDVVDFLFPPQPGKTILHGTVSGTKKVAWIDPIPLQDIRDIGRYYGATINDVLLAVLTNALRKYLVEKDALTVSELLTAMPISLRSADEPLPRTLGNRFGLIPVLLPVGIEDPAEQVRAIKEQVDEIKQSQLPVVSFGLTSVSALLTPGLERAIHKINQAQSIGVTTNVPGPRQPVYLAGAKVLGMWGMGGVSGNMNLSFGIFSLDGELNFAVNSDTAITSDPERILGHFVDSIAELKALSAATA